MPSSDQEERQVNREERRRRDDSDEKSASKRKRNYEEKENRGDDRRRESRDRKHESDHKRRRHRDQSGDRRRGRDHRGHKEDKNDVEEEETKSTAEKAEKEVIKEKDSSGKDEKDVEKDVKEKETGKKNSLLTRAGGAYIPPAKLRMLQEQISDKSSSEYQRISWEALKKSINGLINKVNTANLGNIVRELFQENVVRGRGLLAQAIIKAQSSSPTFTHVYAALTAVVNTKFPKIGELILRRLVLLFRRSYKRNNKAICLSATRFVAHLINQQVAHEILSLEILTLLLQTPTDDSVELTIAFLKECGMKLTDVSPRGINAVFERLRSILHNSEIEKRVQYMVEVMFAIRKDGFKEHPSMVPELDVVDESDQITHLLRLEDAGKTEDILNVFKFDPDYLANEEKYNQIKKELLGGGDSGDSSDGDDDDSDEDGSDENEEGETEKMDILDQTETNMIALRRTVYLTIQSSLDYQECAHKMMKMKIQPNQMGEVCNMVIDCCAQQRSYEKFYGLLAQRFCQLKREFGDEFVRLFKDQYETIHRLETNKLRNIAKFFSHLLYTDAIPWTVLADINLNEEETTSSSRIFIKILMQELAEYMGLAKLNERLKDPTLQMYFEGLFPRDNPRNTRFAINFFTAIGLGGLTDDLREHLKNAPKMIMSQPQEVESSDSSDSSVSSSSESESDDSSSSEESSSSDEEDQRKKRQRKGDSSKKSSEKSTKTSSKKTSKESSRSRR